MRVLLITDTFPPLNNSGAVQLWDLAIGFIESGHHITIMVASPDIPESWLLEKISGMEILRIKTPRLKNINYFSRVIGEVCMPHVMIRKFKQTPVFFEIWDGIVWYSPSIFFAPLIKFLKNRYRCKAYLIIRDIFPDWALDMGLIGRNLPYFFLKLVAKSQYLVADIIGVQAEGNKKYFTGWENKKDRRLETLHNWISAVPDVSCSIDLSATVLSGSKIFVYAGNMGVAQGIYSLLELAESMISIHELGFIFVGRGSELHELKRIAKNKKLNNVLFFDEIPSQEIPGLFTQCHAGLIALDSRHKSHNIPGKFLTYLRSGLPVLAQVNANNDLIQIISEFRVGQANVSNSIEDLSEKAYALLSQIRNDKGIQDRCKALSYRMFSTQTAVDQIIRAIK